MLTIILGGKSLDVTSSQNLKQIKNIVVKARDNNLGLELFISDVSYISEIKCPVVRSEFYSVVNDYGVNITSRTISELLSMRLKDRPSNHKILVLSKDDYRLEVNENNGSYYKFMDDFLTDDILTKIYSFLLPNKSGDDDVC